YSTSPHRPHDACDMPVSFIATHRTSCPIIFFFYCYGAHRDLHSFPTRRSSDLLRHNGRLDLLKQSYHPAFGRHSPGNVLRVLLLQHEIAAGEISSYHIGQVSEWKQRWATRLEPRCHIRIYDPGVRGTLAYLMKSWL